MRRDIEADAAKIRKRTEAEYIREGERGWQRRRNHVEARNRNRELVEQRARFAREDENRLTREAEARFDARHNANHGAKPELDAVNREKLLMGQAVEEGLLKRREAQQTRKDQLLRASREYDRLRAKEPKTLEQIDESVAMASTDELIAAGWGDFERSRIPRDWQTRRPVVQPPATAVNLPRKPHRGHFPADSSSKLA